MYSCRRKYETKIAFNAYFCLSYKNIYKISSCKLRVGVHVACRTHVYLPVGDAEGVHEACQDLARTGHDSNKSVVNLQKMAEHADGHHGT